MPDVRRARQGLAIYFTIVVLISGTLEWLLIRSGGKMANGMWYIVALMWTPALASVVARLTLREGFGDVSFRLGGRTGYRAMLMAWLLPAVIGAIAYGIAWSTGIATFAPAPLPNFPTIEAPLARLAITLGMALTVGQLSSAITAAGEEIGWRGYMLPRMIDAGIPFALPLSGMIWGAWHLPLVLAGMYASGPSPLVSAALFMVAVTTAGCLIGWLRLISGSVWPAVLAHASWNVVIQGVFDRSTTGIEPGGPAAIWVGESGILVVAVLVLVVVVVMRSPFARGASTKSHQSSAQPFPA